MPYYANTEDKTFVKDEIAYIEIKTKLLMKSRKNCGLQLKMYLVFTKKRGTYSTVYVRKHYVKIYGVRQNSLSELLQLYLRSR